MQQMVNEIDRPGSDLKEQKRARQDEIASILEPSQFPQDIGQFGPYRITRLIGKGSSGMVYEAVCPTNNRTSALKILIPEKNSKKVRERFIREAKLCLQIEHPNIVRVYQAGEHKNYPYIETELLLGLSLEDYLKKNGACRPGQIMKLARQLLEALMAIHAKSIIHRDIKPDNVWLTAPDGTVKLLDFGLAHSQVLTAGHITDPSAIIGTPAYMAPEQARGHIKKIDERSDLFSLGVILYHMATGYLPFRGDSVIELIQEIVLPTPPRPVRHMNPGIPEGLAVFIERLLEKDQLLRIQSAKDALITLKAVPTYSASTNRHSAIMPINKASLIALIGMNSLDTKVDMKKSTDTKVDIQKANLQQYSGDKESKKINVQENKFVSVNAKEPAFVKDNSTAIAVADQTLLETQKSDSDGTKQNTFMLLIWLIMLFFMIAQIAAIYIRFR